MRLKYYNLGDKIRGWRDRFRLSVCKPRLPDTDPLFTDHPSPFFLWLSAQPGYPGITCSARAPPFLRWLSACSSVLLRCSFGAAAEEHRRTTEGAPKKVPFFYPPGIRPQRGFLVIQKSFLYQPVEHPRQRYNQAENQRKEQQLAAVAGEAGMPEQVQVCQCQKRPVYEVQAV